MKGSIVIGNYITAAVLFGFMAWISYENTIGVMKEKRNALRG